MSQYDQLGVSTKKEDVHHAIKELDKGLFPNAFCKVYPDIFTNDPDYCLISHADGTGTKSALGYLYWKETGDLSVFKNLATDAMVMNLDDLLCVGATGPYTYTSIINRNKQKIPGEVLNAVIAGTKAFAEKMSDCGIAIHGGETADLGDVVRTITIDGAMQTRMPRKRVINTNIKPGNIIVGLASFGKAVYETRYNSGIGSNGLTLLRHRLFHSMYRKKYPETYEPKIKNSAYRGSYRLTDIEQTTNLPFGKLALSPTRTYAPIIKMILETIPLASIDAIIHCTGGGQRKCLDFGNNVHIIKNNLFSEPPIFTYIKKESEETWRNMYTIFNMGSLLEIYCDKEAAEVIIEISKSFDVDAQIIGYVEPSDKNWLTIESKHGIYNY